jgi:hypothetical protein
MIVHQALLKNVPNGCNVIDCLLIDLSKEITFLGNTQTSLTIIFTFAPGQVPTRENVENQRTQTPYISLNRNSLIKHIFLRHPSFWKAIYLSLLFSLVTHHNWNTEICNNWWYLIMGLLFHEDVLGVQITVLQAVWMQEVNCFNHLYTEP